jgi:hypothetical protein
MHDPSHTQKPVPPTGPNSVTSCPLCTVQRLLTSSKGLLDQDQALQDGFLVSRSPSGTVRLEATQGPSMAVTCQSVDAGALSLFLRVRGAPDWVIGAVPEPCRGVSSFLYDRGMSGFRAFGKGGGQQWW